MKKLRDFKCIECGKFEKLVDDNVLVCKCPKCGELSMKVLTSAKCFNNTVGRSPSSN